MGELAKSVIPKFNDLTCQATARHVTLFPGLRPGKLEYLILANWRCISYGLNIDKRSNQIYSKQMKDLLPDAWQEVQSTFIYKQWMNLISEVGMKINAKVDSGVYIA